MLDEKNIVALKPTSDEVELELDRFDAYQRDQRGLARNTRLQRRQIVNDLLRHSSSGSKSPLHPIDITMLRAFLKNRMERWSPASVSVLASAARAYLQYRKLQGDQVDALLAAILSPACWRLSSLPETLTDEEIEQVLGSFGPPLPSRRRGLAVAQCVAEL
jgi:site-specific recombinase XerD